jgi:hypothetical protein
MERVIVTYFVANSPERLGVVLETSASREQAVHEFMTTLWLVLRITTCVSGLVDLFADHSRERFSSICSFQWPFYTTG